MTAAERAAYDALPSRVTIYRGCGDHNIFGTSWTLDESIARQFPFFHRYRVADPLLVTAQVNKRAILALKQDRDEQEVITFGARWIKIERLKPQPSA